MAKRKPDPLPEFDPANLDPFAAEDYLRGKRQAPPKPLIIPDDRLLQQTSLPAAPDNPTASAFSLAKVAEVVAELAKRKIEALNLYEPLVVQQQFHACMAPERLLRGGNRAGKAQPIDEPVLTPDGWKPIGSLVVGDVVIGGDGLPCSVSGVFPQGRKPVVKIRFGDSSYTRCCREHLWKVKIGSARFGKDRGEWSVVSTQEVLDRCGEEPNPGLRPILPSCIPWMPKRTTPIDPYVLGIMLGDGSMTQFPMLSSADQEIVDAVSDDLPASVYLKQRPVRHVGKSAYDYAITSRNHGGKSTNEFKDLCCFIGVWGKRSYEKFVPHDYLFNAKEIRLAVLQGLLDTDGTISKPRPSHRQGRCVSFTTTSPRLAEDVAFLVRSLGGKCSMRSWVRKSFRYRGEKRLGRPSIRLFINLRDHCPFRLPRKACEWDAWKAQSRSAPQKIMRSIKPDGEADCVCISVTSPDQTYITRDFIITHNTMPAALEVARAVLGKDPFNKYPKTDGRCYAVGLDHEHVGAVMWRKLARAGAFKIIRDINTKLWRAFRPWLPEDVARAKEAKPAPPLIPPRMIRDIAWENKKKGQPKKVILTNGWELNFYSSKGSPPKGVDVDLVWFDEEIEVEEWYPEMAARLLDRDGRFIWSATPQAASDQLFDLHERCEDMKDDPKPKAVEFFISLEANPHLTQEQKELLASKLTEDEQRVRIGGEFAVVAYRVYGEFNRKIHGIDEFDPPANWSHYMWLDPGRQVCATLFIAVPPPGDDMEGLKIAYDLLYLRQCTAAMWGDQVVHKITGRRFVAFGIDRQAGRQNEIGSGLNIEMQYVHELRVRKLESEQTGSNFLWGSDDVKARILMVKRWLAVNDVLGPTFRIMLGKCEPMVKEFDRYHNQRIKGILQDKPEPRNNHAMNDLEYAAMQGCPWVEPTKGRVAPSGAYAAFMQKRAEQAKARGSAYIRLGPGSAE